MDFSIVVPTFNGESRLENCIRGIKNLIIPDNYSYEIIFIDNNSVDNTMNVILNSNLKNLKLFKETEQGLYYARERGINESSSNWIFFIDDDIEVQPNWIIEFFKIINKHKDAGLIAAPLKFPKEYDHLPSYIKTFKTLFAITEDTIENAAKYNFLSSMFCVNKNCYLWLKEKGFKQKLRGRGYENNPFAGGEDIEYSLTIKYSPYKNYVTTDTFGYHYIDKARLNFDNCLKLQEANAFVLSVIGPLILMDKPIFKYISSYYYFLIRIFISSFKKQESKVDTYLYKYEKKTLIKYLLNNKTNYQYFEEEIRKAEWNTL